MAKDWSGSTPSRAASEKAPLRTGSWNLENFTAAKAPIIAHSIVRRLHCPHILAVQEMLDDSGTQQDAIVSASKNAQALIDAIEAESGYRYAYCEVPPKNGDNGGIPGGNIRSGFFYRTDRVALTTPITSTRKHHDCAHFQVTSQGIRLSDNNPAVISPNHEAFHHSRKPLVAQFTDLATQEQHIITNLHLAAHYALYAHHANLPPAPRHGDERDNPDFIRQKRINQCKIAAGFNKALFYAIKDNGLRKTTHMTICGDFNTPDYEHHHDGTRIIPEVLRLFDGLGLWRASASLPPGSSHRIGHATSNIDHYFLSPELKDRTSSVERPIVNDGDEQTRPSDHNATLATIQQTRELAKPAGARAR